MIALVVLYAWFANIPPLKSVVPGGATMKANTAIMIAALGCALLLRGARRAFRPARAVLSAFVLLLALATLAEYATGLNFAIDTAIFSDPSSGLTSNPGRPSIITSFCLALLALAQIALDSRQALTRRISQPLIGIVGCLLLVAILSYAVGVTPFYGLTWLTTGIAVHTIAAISLLAVATLCVDPSVSLLREAIGPSPSARMVRRLGLAAVVLPATLGIFVAVGARARLYDAPFAVSLLVVALTASLVALVRQDGRSLAMAEQAQARANEVLSTMNAQLNARVEDRTRELAARTKELAAREEMQRALLDAQSEIGEGAIVIGHAKFEYVNDAFCAMVGRSRQELLAMPEPLDIVHPEARGFLVEFRRARREDGVIRNRHFEAAFTRSDGAKVEVEIGVTAVANDPGRIFALVRDITRRKEAERARAAVELRFEALANTAHEAIMIGNEAGDFSYVNPACEEVFGWSPEELVGRPILTIVPDRYREAHREGFAHFLATGQGRILGRTVRMEGRRKDGTEFPADLTICAYREAGHLHFAAIVRDATEQVLSEERLTRQARNLDEAQAIAHVGNFELDGDLQRGDWSAELYRITGHPIGEAPPAFAEWLELVHPDDRERMDETVRRALAGEDHTFRFRLRRLDGVVRFVEGRVLAVKDAQGRVSHLRGTIQDITEQHEVEESLMRAKAQAEAAMQAKSVFLASMSHEIRTPLNAVLGAAQLLEGLSLTEEAQEYVGLVRTSGDHLLSIINDILDLSKIEAGRLNVEQQPFDVKDAVLGAIALFRPAAREKGLALNTAIDADVPTEIIGDKHRFRQVIINIVGNAVKFTPHGSVTIRVLRKHTDPDREDELQIDVTDTGPGIPIEEQSKLFQPFSQIETGLTREGGTGLGLAISRRLTELMGGRIWVESARGKGSTFHFTIRAPAARPGSSVRPKAPHAGGSEKPAKSLRILVAEDNRPNRTVIEQLLKRLGHTVEIASNGREAVDRASTYAYDLILMDIQMPVMDGIAATREIRRLPAHQPCIVALTANVFGEDRETYLSAGMNDVLTKPLRLEDLAAVLRRISPRSAPTPTPGSSAEDGMDLDWPSGAAVETTFRAADPRQMADLRATADSPEAFRQLLNEVIESTDETLRKLDTSVSRGDAREVAYLAHQLAGVARLVGAADFRRACFRLEQDAAQDARSLSDDLRALHEEANRMLPEIEAARGVTD